MRLTAALMASVALVAGTADAQEHRGPPPALAHALEACRAEAEDLCASAVAQPEVVAYDADADGEHHPPSFAAVGELLMCFRKQAEEDKLGAECGQALDETVAFHCVADAQRLCPDAEDPRDTHECMRDHRDEVSEECKTAFEAARRHHDEDGDHDGEHHHGRRHHGRHHDEDSDHHGRRHHDEDGDHDGERHHGRHHHGRHHDEDGDHRRHHDEDGDQDGERHHGRHHGRRHHDQDGDVDSLEKDGDQDGDQDGERHPGSGLMESLKACRADVESNCPDLLPSRRHDKGHHGRRHHRHGHHHGPPPGLLEDVIACLREAPELSKECVDGGVTETVVFACAEDRERLCDDAEGPHEVAECLNDNCSDLSEACSAAVARAADERGSHDDSDVDAEDERESDCAANVSAADVDPFAVAAEEEDGDYHHHRHHHGPPRFVVIGAAVAAAAVVAAGAAVVIRRRRKRRRVLRDGVIEAGESSSSSSSNPPLASQVVEGPAVGFGYQPVREE